MKGNIKAIQMSILLKIDDLIGKLRLINIALPIFIFFQPFKQFSGVRNGAFIIILVLFAARLVSGRVRIEMKDRTLQALGLMFGISLLSSLLSPYMAESLDAVRKNLLYQAVIFLVIICEYKGMDDLKGIFYSMLLSFAALTAVIILKYRPAELLNWLEYVDRSGDESFLRGYSLFAVFYVPLAVGYLYSARDSMGVKSAIVFFLILEFLLSVLNNHRTQLVAILLPAFLVTLIAGRYRIFVAALAVCLLAAFIITQARPGSFDRYKTLLTSETYVTNSGLSDRLSIWSGVAEMVKDRPVLGYGYGWKKLSRVARDMGYLDGWDKEGRTYKYFSEKGYGSANPHNLILQILFEVGILGLAAFLFFWATVLLKAASMFFKNKRACEYAVEGASFLKYGATGVILSYAIINATNGLWEESYGILMMTFAACCLVLHREALTKADLRETFRAEKFSQ